LQPAAYENEPCNYCEARELPQNSPQFPSCENF
jgi:hypothetical protein